jgi:hypothetical protein
MQTEAYAMTGQVAAGLRAVDEWLKRDNTEEHRYEAELYRLKGELALRAGETAKRENGEKEPLPDPRSQILDPEGEAEACFLKAIEITQRQHAKSWELRAVMSLARLWQTQGKTAEARQRLAEIYNWFTEGFDTKDLQEAKALLEELQEAARKDGEI